MPKLINNSIVNSLIVISINSTHLQQLIFIISRQCQHVEKEQLQISYISNLQKLYKSTEMTLVFIINTFS